MGLKGNMVKSIKCSICENTLTNDCIHCGTLFTGFDYLGNGEINNINIICNKQTNVGEIVNEGEEETQADPVYCEEILSLNISVCKLSKSQTCNQCKWGGKQITEQCTHWNGIPDSDSEIDQSKLYLCPTLYALDINNETHEE